MRYTTTLILAIVLIVAAALIYVYRDELTGPARPPAERPAASKPLVEGLDLDDLREATLQETDDQGNLATKLAVTKQDDAWRLTAPVSGRADDYEVRRLLRGAVEATYRQTLAPGAEGQPGLADLDLEPPAYRLTLKGTTTDEATGEEAETAVTVDVGRKTAVGDGLYVRLADAEEVFVLESDDLLTRARQRLDKYRDPNLVDLKRDDVVRLTLRTGRATIRLDRAEDGKDRWVLADPLAARADTEAVSDVLRTATGLMAADFVADGVEDFSRYGLADPRLRLTLYEKGKKEDQEKAEEKKEEPDEPDAETDQGEAPPPEPVEAVTLAFGGWADLEQKSVYARIAGSDTVVSVEKADYTKLAKTVSDLRDRHVLALEKDRAAEVTVRVPAKLADGDAVAYTLTREDGTWQVRTEGREPMKADPDAVDALLEELAGLKVLYFAEGEHAEAAKDFKPVGSVRVRLTKEAAPRAFEFGARGQDVPSLVRNTAEEWVGRINEKDLEHLTRDWLQMLDKQVLAFDADRAVRLAIRAPDRTTVFEKQDDGWTMTEPVQEKPRTGFVGDRLDDLKDLTAEKVLAATADPAEYNLAEGELAVTVTLEPDEQKAETAGADENNNEKTQPENADTDPGDGKPADDQAAAPAPEAGQEARPEQAGPVRHTLILAHEEKAKVVGRVQGTDLVYRLPLSLLKDLAAEPLDRDMVDLYAGDAERLEVTAGGTTRRLVKVDDDWFRTDSRGRPDEEVDASKVKAVVDAVADLKAERWAAYDAAEPAAFGLDQPAVRITVTGKDEATTATVLVSPKPVDAPVAALFDTEPLRYAMTEGGKRIAIIAGKPAGTLLEAPATLAPPKPETQEKTPSKDTGKAEKEEPAGAAKKKEPADEQQAEP